jgi:hypothetical protein
LLQLLLYLRLPVTKYTLHLLLKLVDGHFPFYYLS